MSGFIGDKLRLARQFWGLSLSDLCQQVATSRQYIHQLESGEKSPTPEMVEALSSALAVGKDFLSAPLLNSIKLEQSHFRKLLTTPISATQTALAYATVFECLIRILETYVELPGINIPRSHVSSEEDIECAAERCREHWNLGPTSPIKSMTRVLENAGIVVAVFDKISDKVDAFSLARARPIVVRNAAKESLFRQRFDLAHECGHFVMHEGIHTGDRNTEGEANRFASAFLLPRGGFVREFQKNRRLDWQLIYELKLKWKVSAAAILRRAYDLKIINELEYRRGNVHLANTGQKRIEKFDRDYKVEEPEILQKAIMLVLNSGYATLSDIAEQLCVRPIVVRRLLTFVDITAPPSPTDNSSVIHLLKPA